MSRMLAGRRHARRVLSLEALEDRQLFDASMTCLAREPAAQASLVEVVAEHPDNLGSSESGGASVASRKSFVIDADGNGRLDVSELQRWLQWWSQSRQPSAPRSQPEAPVAEPPTVGEPSSLPLVPDYGGADDWHLNQVNAPEAWSAGYTGEGVTVAVIDTGADLNHSELRNRLWTNDDEVPGNGRDDDGNGYIDDTHGWDFVNDDNRPQDSNGHGTHVASLIVGARDGVGTTGAAYGAEVMVLQGLGADGVGSTRDIAQAIRYAVDEGADIVNLSLSGAASKSIESAMRYAEQNGVLVVAASGNDSASTPSAPASLSGALTNVLAVGAVDQSGQLADFSNRPTPSTVMVHAPGVRLKAAVPDGFARMSGTSMATPMVAAVAALAKSAAPNLSGDELRSLLVDHAMETEGDWLMVDAAATVAAARRAA